MYACPRLVAQRGGQEALPGSTFAGDDQVLVLTDPAAVGQPQQLVLVEVAAQREVHVLDGGRVAKAGRLRQSLQTPLMAVVPLGIHQVGQQFVGGTLALGLQAGAQRPRHAVQAHPVELGCCRTPAQPPGAGPDPARPRRRRRARP